jgi:hypothetical protein
VRFFEKQPGESPQAWRAFQVHRDLGPKRSVDRAYRIYSEQQESTKRASGRFTSWSVKHDWVARAQAWDDYHAMVRNEAIAEYERKTGTDLSWRSAKLQEELLSIKEKLVERMEIMAKWPLQRETLESKDGKQITHVYPARWSFHTLVKAIEVLDDSPDKISFTDPTGHHQYGQDPEDVRKLFADLLEEVYDDDEGVEQ